MPRKPRFVLPGVPMHVVQRGLSRSPVFFEDDDYRAYLAWLQDGAKRYRCAVHAYVLMTNHVHVLVTPSDVLGVTRMMQFVGRHYVPFIHAKYGSSGTLWEGRYKASMVHADTYLFYCMRYIELNPLRANMVKAPSHYRWSSYRANAQDKDDPLITPHALYTALGRDRETRTEQYRAMFKTVVDDAALSDIRAAWQTGTPLGNELFRNKVERKLGCKVGQAKRGRPKKVVDDD